MLGCKTNHFRLTQTMKIQHAELSSVGRIERKSRPRRKRNGNAMRQNVRSARMKREIMVVHRSTVVW